jgi:hypothetical protein
LEPGQRRSTPDRDDRLRERSFLPNGVSAVSSLLESSEDVVS